MGLDVRPKPTVISWALINHVPPSNARPSGGTLDLSLAIPQGDGSSCFMKTTTSQSMKSGTKMVKCNCTHDYQDERYGKGNRVANLAPKAKVARCTVCGAPHDP